MPETGGSNFPPNYRPSLFRLATNNSAFIAGGGSVTFLTCEFHATSLQRLAVPIVQVGRWLGLRCGTRCVSRDRRDGGLTPTSSPSICSHSTWQSIRNSGRRSEKPQNGASAVEPAGSFARHATAKATLHGARTSRKSGFTASTGLSTTSHRASRRIRILKSSSPNPVADSWRQPETRALPRPQPWESFRCRHFRCRCLLPCRTRQYSEGYIALDDALGQACSFPVSSNPVFHPAGGSIV